MARGRERYLARAAVVAALVGLAAGCGSSSSSTSAGSSPTTRGPTFSYDQTIHSPKARATN
jgi:ABC-type glycerol-3-phosphate transport system substrate-binding protein